MGCIPPPSGGILGKNRSTRSKTTLRSKRGGVSPKVWRGPLYLFPHSVNYFCFIPYSIVWTYLVYFLFSFISDVKLDLVKNNLGCFRNIENILCWTISQIDVDDNCTRGPIHFSLYRDFPDLFEILLSGRLEIFFIFSSPGKT